MFLACFTHKTPPCEASELEPVLEVLVLVLEAQVPVLVQVLVPAWVPVLALEPEAQGQVPPTAQTWCQSTLISISWQ